jgi:Zn-dependent peptidase ImmA (M78 family)
MSLPVDAETVDAFSLWRDNRPYVFLSMAKTAERSRFDLAHELGHLVMHSRGSEGDPEREADAFGSALLMPREVVLASSTREPATPEILRLRTHFRVSAMAMTRRLHDVGRLSDWAYRQNCVQLTQRGFRSGEPGGGQREFSRVFQVAFGLLRGSGAGVSEVTSELGITVQELHALTFGQVVAPLDGNDAGSVAPRPHLRLIGPDERASRTDA